MEKVANINIIKGIKRRQVADINVASSFFLGLKKTRAYIIITGNYPYEVAREFACIARLSLTTATTPIV